MRTESEVRELCRQRHLKLTREVEAGSSVWVVTSDTGLCETCTTLDEAYGAACTLGSTR